MVHEKRYIDSGSFLKNGSNILSLKLHRHLKVKDLCQYIKSSLKSACKAWGVPVDLSKKEFDHDKVFSFESAEEHKAEILEYLKYDIIALRELYRNYSQIQFECFGFDINRAISISQYAYKCWASDLKEVEHIFVPHIGKEEDDMRAAYYGGRVLPFRREYKSTDFDVQCAHDKRPVFEEITDYLVIADVNSLYPYAQLKNSYAYGKWRYLSEGEIEERMVDDVLNFNADEEWIKRCQFKVDVECPKNLITTFLMERDKDGNLIHSLDDKEEQWYTLIKLFL